MNLVEVGNIKMVGELSTMHTIDSIGSILLSTGKISSDDAERIIALQKQKGLRFGDAAKALGLIDENDIQKALSHQFDFPFQEANKSSFNKDLYAAYQPFSSQVEELRNIRGQLMLRWFSDTRKFLSIVSPNRGEGRSSLAANLAIVFSQLGGRTLLIDADLRQPRQHTLFNLNGGYGLSDMLAGRANSGVITGVPMFRDLSILPAGTVSPNPAELIGRGFKNCLGQLQAQFDTIIIDTPSVEQGMDAQIIASAGGGALVLARQHQTRLNDVQSLKATLEETGCLCLGAVLTDF